MGTVRAKRKSTRQIVGSSRIHGADTKNFRNPRSRKLRTREVDIDEIVLPRCSSARGDSDRVKSLLNSPGRILASIESAAYKSRVNVPLDRIYLTFSLRLI